ncbi:MAG: LysM peptidoglycan-binding domain-containing protein [Anaerolineae bacterium]|nr:LysM peptidoglycan-binding domain-containing protein [Anaerolineae bacterium]
MRRVNRVRAYRVIGAFLAGVLAITGWIGLGRDPALAYQGRNLLQNPGFEEPYSTIDANSALRVAANWQPWHISASAGQSSAINARPEYKPAPSTRVRSGGAAQEYNTFFATHTAGVYQRVPVTANTDLRFSVYVYVWSSATFANPDVSEQPNSVIINVGLDPTGGTDPTSSNIVWSADAEYYDQYRELSVTARSSGTAVTVFVRTAPQGFVGVNNVYLDDAALVPLSEVPPQTGTVEVPSATPSQVVIVPTQEGTITAVPTTPVAPPTFTPNVPTSLPATATPVIPPEFTSTILYTVKAGDTVWGIARQFNSTVAAIIQVNNLPASGLINIGQVLVVPVRDQFPAPPTFTPVPQLPTAAPTQMPDGSGGTGGVPAYGTYTVVRGDTLSTIATRFNTTVAALAQLNSILNPNLIYAGQVLRVPGAPVPVPTQPAPAPTQPPTLPGPIRPATHVVQPGENLYRIALRYGLTVDQLAHYNGIYNTNLIFAGQVLRLPQ